MQRVKLPIYLDPTRAAQQRAEFDGVYPHSALTRLKEFTVPDGELRVDLVCERDESGLAVLRCQLATQLRVECQRCGQPFHIDVERNVVFTPVKSDSAENIPDEYELALIDEQGEINLLELIEDELLLALPIVPMHDEANCPQGDSEMSFGTIDDTEEARPNPFSVLEKLKKSEE